MVWMLLLLCRQLGQLGLLKLWLWHLLMRFLWMRILVIVQSSATILKLRLLISYLLRLWFGYYHCMLLLLFLL